ncbi:hypothetical protein CR983_00215 [Candidatus Saccharibacteria bacterium]|nr:MAG: hypothetical protein CR983_00215 [Candidatus Saccharibacteria bacterium]
MIHLRSLFRTSRDRHAKTPVRRRRLDTEPRTNEEADFRRNRTLTGSTSSHVASANELDARLMSPRSTVHALRKKQRSLGGIFMLTVLLTVLLITALYQFSASISVSLYGHTSVLASEQQRQFADAIEAYYDENPLQRLRFLLNREQLATYLQTHAHNEVRQVVDAQPSGMGGSTIVLKLREPVAQWAIGDEVLYVDGTGALFSENYYQKPRVVIQDENTVTSNDQRAVLASRRLLHFIGQMAAATEVLGGTADKVIVPATTTRQVVVVIDGVKVKMTIDRPAGEQTEDAIRAVKTLRARVGQVKYIDVRVSNKAYYRPA